MFLFSLKKTACTKRKLKAAKDTLPHVKIPHISYRKSCQYHNLYSWNTHRIYIFSIFTNSETMPTPEGGVWQEKYLYSLIFKPNFT